MVEAGSRSPYTFPGLTLCFLFYLVYTNTPAHTLNTRPLTPFYTLVFGQSYVHTRTRTPTRTFTHMYSLTRAHTPARTIHLHVHTYTHTLTYKLLVHTHPCAHTQSHTTDGTCTWTDSHLYTHTHMTVRSKMWVCRNGGVLRQNYRLTRPSRPVRDSVKSPVVRDRGVYATVGSSGPGSLTSETCTDQLPRQ